jgi:hypothetical protein
MSISWLSSCREKSFERFLISNCSIAWVAASGEVTERFAAVVHGFWPSGMSFEPRDYLRHILVGADYLIDRSSGLSFGTLRPTIR